MSLVEKLERPDLLHENTGVEVAHQPIRKPHLIMILLHIAVSLYTYEN